MSNFYNHKILHVVLNKVRYITVEKTLVLNKNKTKNNFFAFSFFIKIIYISFIFV